ncbi:MAG: transaldolase, partial [Gemmatimonadales bacterium]
DTVSANPLVRLGRLGQSPWLDFITRDLLTSGELERLIAEDGLRGMTTNPTIFEKAVATSELYDEEIRALAAAEGELEPAAIFERLAVADVQRACDLFGPLYERTGGRDGFVSIEVSPRLAYDPDETIRESQRLWTAVGRPNVLIKIPGTRVGLAAVLASLERGINVNITLLFAVERYAEVIEAYLAALERRVGRGAPIDRIASVASFFVSRVDTKIDKLLDTKGSDAARRLRGTAAIANAQVAYQLFERAFSGPRWERLRALGAAVQRPLWASTSTKDPAYPDTYYVEALVAPYTVNTLPPETLAAYRDHGNPEVRIAAGRDEAQARLRSLAGLGIDLARATAELEEEGVAKFAASFAACLSVVEAKAAALTRT